MTMICGKHAQGKCVHDQIFEANAQAVAAAAKFGKDNVINATIGSIQDENEKLVCLPTVEKVFKGLPMNEIAAYAPISGIVEYLDLVQEATFGKFRPQGVYTAAVATSGGCGGIHHAIWNYMDEGDTALCGDWFWGTYRIICEDLLRKLTTYKMFDDDLKFNFEGLEAKIKELLAKQDRLLYILNTPGHNPTGFSISEGDFAKVLDILKRQSAAFGKPITLLLDVAYIDFSGDKDEVRKFFKQLENLPSNIFTVICYAMSKGFTMYGQRTGAMIGCSTDEAVVKEFAEINQYTSRATWSNINRACQKTLITIYKDPALLEAIEAERAEYYAMLKKRADLFTEEAKACGLRMIPYVAGFFMSIPTTKSKEVCEELKKEQVYCVALAAGVRVAICGVCLPKIKGLAKKIKDAMDKVGA